jgi:5-methylcytosine-specific restriction enzyme A
MELVNTREEIIKNTVLFNSYRHSKILEDRKFYKERLRLGNTFVNIKISDKDIFCPSRFAGYKNNNRQEHEAFAQRHGTHTNNKIDSILGKHILKKEFENKYLKFCQDVGVTPSNKKKRQYWLMSISTEELLQTESVHINKYPDELSPSPVYPEGALKQVTVNAYERNEEARKKCIDHFGYKCVVCGFTFSEKYGEIGVGYIHVHHLKPPSEIKKEYQIDPIKDLRPVCPNCHAMLHKDTPPYSVDMLKEIIKKNLM